MTLINTAYKKDRFVSYHIETVAKTKQNVFVSAEICVQNNDNTLTCSFNIWRTSYYIFSFSIRKRLKARYRERKCNLRSQRQLIVVNEI